MAWRFAMQCCEHTKYQSQNSKDTSTHYTSYWSSFYPGMILRFSIIA
jgi:hypothetical protein